MADGSIMSTPAIIHQQDDAREHTVSYFGIASVETICGER